jgi:pimeloyl-ACP methyl ester carboxylesterase
MVHRVVRDDGTTIAGRVHGQGPPLVLIHGGGGDGESSWRMLLPHLVDRFTCYAMSTRGRGLSDDHPDHSIGALIGDVAAFVESIVESTGTPVGAVGYSSGLALAAAARTDAISAVAVHEPAVPAIASDDDPRLSHAIEAMAAAADQGRYAEAVRVFFEDSGLFNDDEAAALSAHGLHERMAPNVPVWLAEMPEFGGAVDPAVLGKVTVPVLLLRGTRSPGWFHDSVRFVAGHLVDVRMGDIDGGGHMAVLVRPDVVAGELARFFAPAAAAPPVER